MCPRIDRVPIMHDQLHDMLLATQLVLDDADIHFTLGYGTALGAVREGDYIPWDLDIDLLVFWRDQEKIIAALADLPAPYRLAYNEPGYQYEFARVIRDDVPHELLHLDLFPLAPTFETPQLALAHLNVLRRLAWIPWARKRAVDQFRDASIRRRIRALAVTMMIGWIPRRVVHKLFVAAAGAVKESSLLVNVSGSYGLREIVPALWFDNSQRVSVRGHALPVPSPAHEYLTHMYGDFMTPPDKSSVAAELDKFAEVYKPVLGQLSIILTQP